MEKNFDVVKNALLQRLRLGDGVLRGMESLLTAPAFGIEFAAVDSHYVELLALTATAHASVSTFRKEVSTLDLPPGTLWYNGIDATRPTFRYMNSPESRSHDGCLIVNFSVWTPNYDSRLPLGGLESFFSNGKELQQRRTYYRFR